LADDSQKPLKWIVFNTPSTRHSWIKDIFMNPERKDVTQEMEEGKRTRPNPMEATKPMGNLYRNRFPATTRAIQFNGNCIEILKFIKAYIGPEVEHRDTPYINGKELEMDGALPIGIIPEMDFAEMTFVLEPGDSLMLMSDGIVEATNAEGALFGFERISAMLEQQTSAEAIATAAQEFGQEDDILVLQVRRNLEQPVAIPA